MSYMRTPHYIFRSHAGFVIDMEVTVTPANMDEFVVMRYAEMTPGVRARAEKRAVAKHKGNGGCAALARELRRRSA